MDERSMWITTRRCARVLMDSIIKAANTDSGQTTTRLAFLFKATPPPPPEK